MANDYDSLIIIKFGKSIPQLLLALGTLAGPALMRSFVLGFSSSWISSGPGIVQAVQEAIMSQNPCQAIFAAKSGHCLFHFIPILFNLELMPVSETF